MKVSGYLTSRNLVQMGYPFEASIRSLFPFCDEIVVCDTSNGTDGTREKLEELAIEFGKDFLIISPDNIKWADPNHGIYDGITKGIARQYCTGDYCFQIDSDEVVNTTREQIEKCCTQLTDELPLLALPVIEFWGSKNKVRIDVNIWKWRLSKNDKNITHGIPAHLRKIENGLLYSHPGSDGCDYIFKDSGKIVPCINFVPQKVEAVRQKAIHDKAFVPVYENWVNQITDRLPTIYHFSWWSVYEKMLKYKLFWNNSWMSLYNEKRPEGYNPFFNKPFEQVTEQEMRETAKQIEEETSGHIFHQPYISGQSPKTNHIAINKSIPELVKDWCEKHKT